LASRNVFSDFCNTRSSAGCILRHHEEPRQGKARFPGYCFIQLEKAQMVNSMTHTRGRMLILPLFVVALALLVVGCDSGASSVNRPTATATPSPTPVPRILYQSNWSSDASQWHLTPGWKLSSSGLSNSGYTTSPLMIPYTPTVTDYTISIALKVNAVRGNLQACGNEYGLEGETPEGKAVYYAAITCIQHNLHTFADIISATNPNEFDTNDYTPSLGFRSYIIVVRGEYVTYQVNTAFVGAINCDLPTSPSRLALINTNMDTTIQSITITTP
jgi:hypothetical protein